jgi:hypothetical protein
MRLAIMALRVPLLDALSVTMRQISRIATMTTGTVRIVTETLTPRLADEVRVRGEGSGWLAVISADPESADPESADPKSADPESVAFVR